MTPQRIPVIDIGPYFGGDARAKRAVAQHIGDACESIGFLVIANHSVARDLIDRAFAAGRQFFDQPAEVKARFKPSDGVIPRGYHALGTRNLAKTLGIETPPDLREQFFIGPLRDQ
ncbi:MAG: 2-oxoglutarate and iron-dependent oxygenase domain-containing protein, partial [Alphaproteobacteria bacterium]|nr:2-oxoglutarate and iron-dependent oxygenase domain-containing protein [Alphaproteobacteria bacterium]